MITLAIDKILRFSFMDEDMEVTIKIPTAIATAELMKNNLTDIDLFKKFTIKVSCPGIAEIDGNTPSNIITLPGTYGIVTHVAKEIVKSAVLSVKEKNADRPVLTPGREVPVKL